jgi:Protein of unknown function (DUF1569)
MRTVFDAAVRDELRMRIERVTAQTHPHWGKMNAPQMLAHLNAALAMGLGELKVAPKRSPLANPLGRWLAIYALPFPKGAPTAPELQVPASGDWERELARFRDLLERTGAGSPTGTWPRHPVFGAMSGKQWGDLTFRHIDHHLRQFGG